MKNKLNTMLAAKELRKAEITTKAQTCDKVEELRGLNAELDGVNEEIRSLGEMIAGIKDEPNENKPVERTQVVNSEVPGIVVAGAPTQTKRSAEPDDMEYRTAFMQFVTRGTVIPTELRTNENTLTTDVATAIPTIVVNQIIEKMETMGMILPLVTRTNYASGINIPTSTVKPVATWVSEGKGSDKQKKGTAYITFSKFKLRCEISTSMEVSVMAISAFEASFVRQVSEAMVKAQEESILNGDGVTQPTGILKETPATGRALTASALDYDLLIKAESALPQAYENGGVWCMTKKTFMEFVGMVDTNKQPIARVNYGISGAPERTLLGRTVLLCGDYMDSFSPTLTTGKVFAFIFKFSDYVLNTVYDMGIQKKQDWDTEDMLTKAVMSVDGKVVDKSSLVTIKKAA